MRHSAALPAKPWRLFSGLALLIFITACSGGIKGDFGWSRTDDRDIREPEISLLQETEFRFERENLYFFDHETIWWAYQIREGGYDREGFLAALYENNNTPDPVLFDLRRVSLVQSGCCDYIRQSYERLEPGRYLLKIAYDSVPFDQVNFTVVPPEGPSGLSVDDDLAEDNLEFDSAPEDEIEFYSRGS